MSHSSSRIRRPSQRTLSLPNGDWLLVKDHLTAGDQRQVLRGSMKRVRNLEGLEIEAVDALQAPLAQAVAYLLDWSLVDPEGVPISIKGLDDAQLLAVLDMLPPEDCDEICRAIDRHDDAMRRLRADEKKNEQWRDEVASDLAIARLFGWRYEWVGELDADVYGVLVDTLARDAEE